MGLAVTIMYSAEIERFCHHRKFYWMVLLWPDLPPYSSLLTRLASPANLLFLTHIKLLPLEHFCRLFCLDFVAH